MVYLVVSFTIWGYPCVFMDVFMGENSSSDHQVVHLEEVYQPFSIIVHYSYRSTGFTVSFTLRWHPALVVRKHDIIVLRYLASLFFGPIQFFKSTCGFRNIKCFTGKSYWPFAQPPTWRARCCSSSDLSPGTCPARLNLPGTAVPVDRASRVTKVRKPSHHDKVQHSGR